MSNSFFFSWILVMFPLVFSPGPANIVFAASGLKFGVKNSIFLLLGIDLIFVIKSIIIGFGLGELLKNNPIFLDILQIFGAFYLIYLAYGFLEKNKMETDGLNDKLGFFDGVLIQIFNVKGWILVTLMFSLFANSNFIENQTIMTILLILMLCILNVSIHFLWIVFGASIIPLLVKKQNLQNLLFSSCLVLVSVWFLIDNRLVKEFFIY